ncbi:MAG TPA: tryptophan--tRNA ligase [Leptospiraceae bacterium]|nr:tryptophan--tRNA ligase [Leptospiraceae bacterium]HMY67339.1 tryptophan--tRNA ligase [Leptospiraceae bacterium]HNI26700.1 tryptophan--tRNA ligase [Leptospiraceae bacterium]HNM03466.1 tryptophan--tRNA ligase [Leptospiraceae bacterium]HNN05460.1 tryptophan--tRNA ligase [Leptospiraceae bacterium]
MKRILTGLQPSGKLHLGNYFSVMRKMIGYQNSSDLFLFIADLHSLTTFQSKEILQENIYDAVCDFLALGLDPDRCTFWIQSDVPEVTELTWYLSMCITVNQLELAHSYKDKTAKGFNPSAGLFCYPVLMASDILAFDSDVVPVGKDQKQHLEFTRDIAQRFNQNFGEVFKLPLPEIEENTAVIPGTDGQKMSKSYKNTINIFDDEKKLRKSVMSIVSDSAGVDEAKDPDKSVIYSIYSLFCDEEEKKKLRERFLTPGLRYGDIKKELADRITEYFAPYRKKRDELLSNLDYVEQILSKGKEKAGNAAEAKLSQVRKTLGVQRKIKR